jgi:hypothetical protein
MDDKLLLALVAACSAIVGGLITSILAPWVKHRIEVGTAEVGRKRQLISDWRQMIVEITRDASGPDDARVLLQNHPAFLSLEPHLNEQARRAAYARLFTVAAGVEVPYPIHVI